MRSVVKLARDRSDELEDLKARFLYQERIRRRIMGHVKEYSDDSDAYQPTFDALRLRSYWDADYDMVNAVSEESRYADDELLDQYIHRLCTRSVIDVASGHANNDTSPELGLFPELNEYDYYRTSIAHSHDPFSDYERALRKKEKLGRKDKKKKEEKERADKYVDPKSNVPECVAVHSYKNTPLITMTLRQLRKCIFMECQHKLRKVHFHYMSQFEDHEKERINSIMQVIKLKEKMSGMIREQERTEDYIRHFKETCHSLESKVETSKEAKRRRRQAKKQRVRSEQAACIESKSETRSADHNGGHSAEKKSEGSLSD